MGDKAHACRGEPLSFGNTLFTKAAVLNIQKLEIKNNKYLQNMTAFVRLALLPNLTVVLLIFFTATYHTFLSEILEKNIHTLCTLMTMWLNLVMKHLGAYFWENKSVSYAGYFISFSITISGWAVHISLCESRFFFLFHIKVWRLQQSEYQVTYIIYVNWCPTDYWVECVLPPRYIFLTWWCGGKKGQ